LSQKNKFDFLRLYPSFSQFFIDAFIVLEVEFLGFNVIEKRWVERKKIGLHGQFKKFGLVLLKPRDASPTGFSVLLILTADPAPASQTLISNGTTELTRMIPCA